MESGSCAQGPWSFGIHRTRKRGLRLLAVCSSGLHLCSWPSATGSARSTGSAVVLCVYCTVMFLPSWRFIEPLPQSEAVPGSWQGACYGDLLTEHSGNGWSGFGLFGFFFF